jgi:hypothetical protein
MFNFSQSLFFIENNSQNCSKRALFPLIFLNITIIMGESGKKWLKVGEISHEWKGR